MFNYSLHGLRGFAALMVYIAHSCNGFREHICNGCGADPYLLHIYYLGTYGVEVFFFLSGYVIVSASLKSSTSNFIKHRFWRIFPLFFFITFLYFVLNHFIQKAPEKDDFGFFLLNIFFVNLFLNTPGYSPNTWSITYEVWFYILTFLFLHPIVIKKHYLLTFIAIIASIFFVLNYPISIYYLLGALTNYFMRNYKSRLEQLNLRTINIIQFICLTFVVLLASKGEYHYHWEHMNRFDIYLLMISFWGFMITLFYNGSLLSKLLSGRVLLFIGTVSYSLYLTHPYSYLVARMTTQELMQSGFSLTLLPFIYIPLNIILTIIFVGIIFKFVENFMYKFGTGKEIYQPAYKEVIK